MKKTFRQARYAARMTKKQVAEYLKLSPRTVARYEQTNCTPKVSIECLLLLGGKMPTMEDVIVFKIGLGSDVH